MKTALITLVAVMALSTGTDVASAHEGGLNRDGCHDQNSDDTYHCHRDGYRR